MIRFVKGILHKENRGSVIVETKSGFGMEVFVPTGSEAYMKNSGEEIMLYTSMRVREDDMSLYGFDTKKGLELFDLLTTVNGVGPKAALAIMSVMSPDELIKAIGLKDAKSLTKAAGIGKKTADRIVLELKDKIADFGPISDGGNGVEVNFADFGGNTAYSEALSALVSLGYSNMEATAALSKIKDKNLSAEEYIKKALGQMM